MWKIFNKLNKYLHKGRTYIFFCNCTPKSRLTDVFIFKSVRGSKRSKHIKKRGSKGSKASKVACRFGNSKKAEDQYLSSFLRAYFFLKKTNNCNLSRLLNSHTPPAWVPNSEGVWDAVRKTRELQDVQYQYSILKKCWSRVLNAYVHSPSTLLSRCWAKQWWWAKGVW